MKIVDVEARWLHCPIAPERQHVSDFGRIASFDMALVRVETDDGSVGWGEAKAAVGSAGSCAALVACINDELGPALVGQDPRRINELGRPACTTGRAAGYAATRGRAFPILGRRGLTVSAISGIDMALWDLLGRSLGAPVVDLWGGPCRRDMALYASGGWADADGIGDELGGYVAAGFGAVKMRVGVIDGTVDASVARVAAAREALGAGRRPDGRRPRHVQRRRGQALRRRRRAARRALVRGAGERRRPRGMAEVRASTQRGHRRRRERVHPLRLPRPDRATAPSTCCSPTWRSAAGRPRAGASPPSPRPTSSSSPRTAGDRRCRSGRRQPRLRQPGGHGDRVLAGRQPAAARPRRRGSITVEHGRVAAPTAPGPRRHAAPRVHRRVHRRDESERRSVTTTTSSTST